MTAEKVATETGPALLEAAYAKFQLNSALKTLGDELDASEKGVVAFLRQGWQDSGNSKDHPLLTELFGAGASRNAVSTPLTAEDHHQRGMVDFSNHQFEKALVHFTAATRLDPNRAPSHYMAGRARFEMKDYDRALADYDRAIRLDPQSEAARTARDRLLRAKRDAARILLDGRS